MSQATKNHSTKEVAAIVRKALADRYGHKSVSVTKGRGTASHWIDATVSVDKPSDCFCKDGQPYCQRCGERIRETSQEARGIALGAIEKAGAQFSTYYSDGPECEARDCFLLQVRINK